MTKSQTIRNSFLTVNNILKCISSNYNARLLSMFLNIKVQDYLKDSDYLMTDLFRTLIKMQLLIDLYIHDIYSDKKDNDFHYIKRAMEEKDVNYVFNNLNVLIASCNSNIFI